MLSIKASATIATILPITIWKWSCCMQKNGVNVIWGQCYFSAKKNCKWQLKIIHLLFLFLIIKSCKVKMILKMMITKRGCHCHAIPVNHWQVLHLLHIAYFIALQLHALGCDWLLTQSSGAGATFMYEFVLYAMLAPPPQQFYETQLSKVQ